VYPPAAGYYDIAEQDYRFALWGFNGPPSHMTPNGQRLFLNLLKKIS
jgi:hypothetical protein